MNVANQLRGEPLMIWRGAQAENSPWVFFPGQPTDEVFLKGIPAEKNKFIFEFSSAPPQIINGRPLKGKCWWADGPWQVIVRCDLQGYLCITSNTSCSKKTLLGTLKKKTRKEHILNHYGACGFIWVLVLAMNGKALKQNGHIYSSCNINRTSLYRNLFSQYAT